MEGLIPFIIKAIRKPSHGPIYRSLSQSSSRGNLLLAGENSMDEDDPSSRRRTRSEYQPPSFDFLEERSVPVSDYNSLPKTFNGGTPVLSPSITNVSKRIITAANTSHQVSSNRAIKF